MDEDEAFDGKMEHLVATLQEQFAESARLEQSILASLRSVGYAP